MQSPAGLAQGRWLGFVAMAIALVLLLGWGLWDDAPVALPGSSLQSAGRSTASAELPAPARHPEALAAAGSSVDSTRARLFARGSLAGTEMAGGWCVVAGPSARSSVPGAGTEVLQPCAELRRRFDHYLLGAPAPKWMTDGVPQVRKGGPIE